VRNPSGEDSPFQSAHEGITLITPDRNLGYAGGMNHGIRDQLAKGRELILLLTMDVRLDPGAVAQLCHAAQTVPAFGVLGPELRWSPDGHMSWGVRWDESGNVEHVLSPPQDSDGDSIVESDSIDGAVVLLKSQVLKDLGPLVDRLFMYYEETEFCLRAKRAGWRVGVVLGAVAEQSSGESRRPGAFNYLMARNGLEFARLVAGRRGVVSALRRYVVLSYMLTKMRFSPKSDRQRQRRATVSLIGIWKGVAAYFGRRWGPPPPNLPGLGDMTHAG
jgi:GT2 family glycosyltransferase